MITFSYNISEDIIFINRAGKIYINDIIDNINRIDEEYSDKRCLKIIDDIRNQETLHDYSNDLEIIINAIKSKAKKYDLINSEIIVEDLRDTAYTMIYETMSNEIDSYNIKIFTTVKAAKSWLIGQ